MEFNLKKMPNGVIEKSIDLIIDQVGCSFAYQQKTIYMIDVERKTKSIISAKKLIELILGKYYTYAKSHLDGIDEEKIGETIDTEKMLFFDNDKKELKIYNDGILENKYTKGELINLLVPLIRSYA